jgi:DNA polymerase-4
MTGIPFCQAKRLCPDLGYVVADFQKYIQETELSREVYAKYGDPVIPYGMDEAFIDLSDACATMDEAAQLADVLRIEIMYSLGLSASVGVSDNLIFSKIGSDYKKPNAVTVITKENYQSLVWPLPATDLLYVGKERAKTLSSLRIKTIGDIAKSKPEVLAGQLGKAGMDIWRFANGDDSSFKPALDTIGSLGHTITPPNDLYNDREASAIIYMLVSSICARLRMHSLKACTVGIRLRDNQFNAITRRCSFKNPSDNIAFIFNQAYNLFKRHFLWNNPLRSIGVTVDNLFTMKWEQLSYLENDGHEIAIDIDERVKELTRKFGALEVEQSAARKG